MGIYDRDYYQPQQQGFTLRRPQTVVMTLIVINVGIYVVNSLFLKNGLIDLMVAQASDLQHPLQWWRFLTYGFSHDPAPMHVAANMIGLFFLGREVEQRYGRNEFLAFYLLCIVVSGMAWAAANLALGVPGARVIGASGAVVGVIVLFAFNFPRRTILLFFVFPVPAWVLGLLVVLSDLFGATGLHQVEGHIAYAVHLAGAAFAALYYKSNWRITGLFGNLSFDKAKWRRSKFRVVKPDDMPERGEDTGDDELTRQADAVLDKINREGIDSLTRKERKILEKASKQAQERRGGA